MEILKNVTTTFKKMTSNKKPKRKKLEQTKELSRRLEVKA